MYVVKSRWCCKLLGVPVQTLAGLFVDGGKVWMEESSISFLLQTLGRTQQTDFEQHVTTSHTNKICVQNSQKSLKLLQWFQKQLIASGQK
jgi:hypothetical protein